MKNKIWKITGMLLCIVMLFAVISVIASGADESKVVAITDKSTVWSYLDNNTDPAEGMSSPLAWTDADFDDGAWKSAAGSFGSKNGQLEAVNGNTPTVLLDLKTNGSTTNKAYFFRTKVNLSDVEKLDAVSFKVYADDAVVVYVNGGVLLDTRKTKNETTSLHYAETSANTSVFWLDGYEAREFFKEGENTIAVSVHNSNSTSSDIYFYANIEAYYGSGNFVTTFENVMLGVGEDETQRTLNWYTTSSSVGEVQWAPASEMVGGKFPSEYSSATATTSRSSNRPGVYINKATVTGISENVEYVYRLKNGTKYSGLYYFNGGEFSDFEFFVLGDPQIRMYSFTYSTTDIDYWERTLQKIDEGFDAELYLSMGDQINVNTYEEEYEAFLSDRLTSMAFATTVGNHDNGTALYSDHFNMPNLSDTYGKSTTSSNYWFTYGNVLFISLNTWADTNDNHAKYVKEAVDANPDTDWQVVFMHVSPFSAGSHVDESNVASIRNNLTPYFNDYGIDVVLGATTTSIREAILWMDRTLRITNLPWMRTVCFISPPALRAENSMNRTE